MRSTLLSLGLLSACMAHSADPNAEIDKHNAAVREGIRLREEEAARKQSAEDARVAREQEELREADEQLASARAAREADERATAAAKAAAEPEAEPRPDPERASEDEGYMAYQWAEKSCKLSQDDPHYVRHCNPICWDEEVIPCPVFTCTAKPPTAGWVELANQRACTASRGTTSRKARRIGEGGFPPPQGPQR
jgi:hypothetical protein